MRLDKESPLNKSEKIYLISRFMDRNPLLEIQDLYKWLYYGEFGYEETNTFLRAKRNRPNLQQLLDEISDEKINNIKPSDIWQSVGCSHRYLMVFISPFYENNCPLVRMVNLMERSHAFSGSRMQFKLDWSIVKEYALSKNSNWTKDDFYQFEDRIGFHSLPSIGFSESYLNLNPFKYRVLSQKLFFNYFPEFYDSMKLLPPKNSSPSIG